MKINKKGFTLIEILIVVLIIGILAAVALPQYRKAVAQAQLTQIINITKSVKLAQERYYLVNEQFTGNFNNLDISIDNKNIVCGFDNSYDGSIHCYNEKFIFWVYLTFNFSECAAKTNNSKSALAYACKEFLKTNKCVVGNTGSCSYLGLTSCFYCQNKHSKIF